MGFKLQLKDGRSVGVIRHGDPNGSKLFVFHGFPGSRNQFNFLKANPTFNRHDIIILDRPGFGLSCPHPKRTLLGWADDVAEVADHFAINEFNVLGVSGGAPYALACSVKLKSRIKNLGLVCGLGPMHLRNVYTSMPLLARISFALASRYPRLCASFIGPFWLLFKINDRLFFDLMAMGLSREDKKLLKSQDFFSTLVHSVNDSIINGLGPLATELHILSKPWGFELEEVPHKVHCWHGDQDFVVPFDTAVKTMSGIPNKVFNQINGAGHYSAPINSVDTILRSLIQQ